MDLVYPATSGIFYISGFGGHVMAQPVQSHLLPEERLFFVLYSLKR